MGQRLNFYCCMGVKPQLNKIHNPTLVLSDGHLILHTASARNLSFIFDSHLFFSDHISSVFRARFYQICHLRRIRPVLDFNTACTIGTYFFTPDCLPQTQLSCIQNAFARAVVPAPILTVFSNRSTGSRDTNALYTKLFPLHYKLTQSSFPRYLRESNLRNPIDHPHCYSSPTIS